MTYTLTAIAALTLAGVLFHYRGNGQSVWVWLGDILGALCLFALLFLLLWAAPVAGVAQ